MELNTTMSVLRQFSLKQWNIIYTIQKHKICLLVKTTCYESNLKIRIRVDYILILVSPTG